jgi:heavy metal sensor kinase
MKLLNSLRVRLVLWTVVLEALLLVVLAGLFTFSLRNIQNREIDETLRLSAAQLNAVVDVYGDSFEIPQTDVITLRERGISAWILTTQGEVAATVSSGEAVQLPDHLPESGHYIDENLSSGAPVRLFRSPLTEGQQYLGEMVLAISLTPVQTVTRQALISLSIAIPIVLLLSASGGLFLAGRALSPVAAITETARQISAADLGQRLDDRLPDDEIGQLARTFNAMLERLDKAFRRERQFTADASHELRTPLGMLKTQLSLARSRPRSVEELLKMMADMEGDVDRMTHLVEQMLTLARVEQHGLDGTGIVDLNKLLPELVGDLQERAREEQVALELTIPSRVNLSLTGDEEQLRQVLVNLVENGLKYTPPGGRVMVTARRHWQTVIVTISNTGEGIPAEHLPHLFERFYRIDNARTRASGGFGLGLAISRAIVQAHHGQIDVDSKPGVGTTFTITLPGRENDQTAAS